VGDHPQAIFASFPECTNGHDLFALWAF